MSTCQMVPKMVFKKEVTTGNSYPEIVYSLIWHLPLDPIQCGVVSGAVFFFHKVGQVRHSGQLVEVRARQVFRLEDHGNPKVFLGDFHGSLAVLRSVFRIQAPPMRHQPWGAVVQEGAQVETIVPVCGEVLDLAIWQHCFEPGQHQLFRWEV